MCVYRVNHDGLNRCLGTWMPAVHPFLSGTGALCTGCRAGPVAWCQSGGSLWTNGATEAITSLPGFCGSHSAVWIPTFSEYADACRLHGHRVEGISSLEKLTGNEGIFWL